MSNTKTAKRLAGSMITVIILAVCLCITTFALVWLTVSADNNRFHTGSVDIDLNNGRPIIKEQGFLFEPGMTVKKDFFIANNSTWDVYYKIYFSHVEGGLADVLQITIKDSEKTLYKGTATELSKENVTAADDPLKIGQQKELTMYFHYPENKGNESQNLTMSFDLCADAVQTKNNSNKLFD